MFYQCIKVILSLFFFFVFLSQPSKVFIGLIPRAEASFDYLYRPDILDVDPEPKLRDKYWSNLRRAQLLYVAQLLETYPDHQLIFLARDTEYIYDLARLATQGTPDADRIHLANVSRRNVEDYRLKSYLAQFGLTDKALSEGKSFVFIDTGFRGSIPNKIQKSFGRKNAPLIQTHMILSENHIHPSSRSFLFFLDQRAIILPPERIHGPLLKYEDLPRFYPSSNGFYPRGGRIEPIVKKDLEKDSSKVYPEQALELMKDLAYFWSKPETQTWYHQMRLFYRDIVRVMSSGNPHQVGNLLNYMESSVDHRNLVRAMVLDIYEALILNDEKLRPLSLEYFGVERSSLYDFVEVVLEAKKKEAFSFSHKGEVEFFNYWIKRGEWELLDLAIQGSHDDVIQENLVKAMFHSKPSEKLFEKLRVLVRQDYFSVNDLIAKELLPQAVFLDFDGIAMDIVKSKNGLIIDTLIRNYFSLPRSKGQEEVVLEILKLQTTSFHEDILKILLTKEHGLDMKKARQYWLETAAEKDLKLFIKEMSYSGLLNRHELIDSILWLLSHKNPVIRSAVMKEVPSWLLPYLNQRDYLGLSSVLKAIDSSLITNKKMESWLQLLLDSAYSKIKEGTFLCRDVFMVGVR
jgi:hypothetical protein